MTPGGPTGAAKATVLVSASLTMTAAAIIAPALPAMAENLSGYANSEMLVRLALTVTALAIAVTAPFAGALADTFGRRRVLLTALALYATAGAAGAVMTDPAALLASRAVLGVAIAGLLTAITALVTDWFEGVQRIQFLGSQQVAASVGGLVLLPLAGVLAGYSWQATFLLYAVAAVVLPIAYITIRETSTARQDRPETAEPPPGNPTGGWRIAGIAPLAFAMTAVFFMAPTQLPFSLAALGAPTWTTGVVIAASTATGALGALAYPRLARRLSSTLITGLSLLALGVGWVLVGAAPSIAQTLAGVAVGGVGVGLAVPNLNVRLAGIASPATRGKVLSTLVSAIFLGQFASPLLAQPFIAALGASGVFLSAGIAVTATAAITLAIPRLTPAHPSPLRPTPATITHPTERKAS